MAQSYSHLYIRVPAALRAQAKEVFVQLSEPGAADGMFDSGFNATGVGPATHYISSGLIDSRIVAALGSAQAMFDLYTAMGGSKYTLPQVTTFFGNLAKRLDARGVEAVVLGLDGMKPTAG